MIEPQNRAAPHPAAAAWWRCFFNRELFVRLVCLVLLLFFYYAFDWLFLRGLLCDCVTPALRFFGHQVNRIFMGTQVVLKVDAALYCISADCTYLKLFFLLAPFYWRFNRGVRVNGLRLVLLAVVIFFINVVRVSLSLYLDNHGVSWTVGHTLPDTLFHLIPLTIFVSIALRRDTKNKFNLRR